MNQSDYLQQRVEEQIKWMSGKSKSNQRMYKGLKLVEIFAGASIPLLVGYSKIHPSIPVITGAMGVLIVVLNGIQQLNKYHENWLTYRTTIEALKTERMLFETQTDPYNAEDAFPKFVHNFESLLANENKTWKANWTAKAPVKTGS